MDPKSVLRKINNDHVNLLEIIPFSYTLQFNSKIIVWTCSCARLVYIKNILSGRTVSKSLFQRSRFIIATRFLVFFLLYASLFFDWFRIQNPRTLWIFLRPFFSLEEFIYNYLITLSKYIIPKKGV